MGLINPYTEDGKKENVANVMILRYNLQKWHGVDVNEVSKMQE